jgi:hypothetical protein
MVMLGLAFSKIATSSSHSLCCCGCWEAGGAQSMLIVTGAELVLLPVPVLLALAAAVLLALVLLLAGLLELLLVQAAALKITPATAATATIGR